MRPGPAGAWEFRPTALTEEPIYFSSGGRQLFGWLHRTGPGPRQSGLGMVICKPFGYEATCAHRSLGAFAQAAASAGFPTLRFDYGGTGDSEDIGASADQLSVWTE